MKQSMTASLLVGLSILLLSGALLIGAKPKPATTPWTVATQAQWTAEMASSTGLEIKDGLVSPTAKTATFTSKLKTFSNKRSAKSLVVSQTVAWENWIESPKQLGPKLRNAPILLPISKGNYWMFGCYSGGTNMALKSKTPVKIKGLDEEVYQTKTPNLYVSKVVVELYGKQAALDMAAAKAPTPKKTPKNRDKAKKAKKPKAKSNMPPGYHGWQSPDMVNWVYRGPIARGNWATTAEYADGKLYMYVDTPNDWHPFLTIDEDLFDGKPGKAMGMIFKDPTKGSDCAVIRDEKGFHLFSEDWSPIDASKHSWDSPLAQRAFSPDSIKPFEVKNYAVDYRTKSTGKTATHRHPNFQCTYTVHEGEQPAYGDWAGLRIGEDYYLVGDNHTKKRGDMSVMLFTSKDITKQFKRLHTIPSKGHPDPSFGFAEGKFWLITQAKDFTSPGPWVDGVEARAGVDTDKDGKVDVWGKWQTIKEGYTRKPGYAKLVDKAPARLDLSELPAGYGFAFEFKLTDTTENASKPILDTAVMQFK